LPLDSISAALNEILAQVYRHYAALMRIAAENAQEHLGGKLLYAGELNEHGSALTIAGNIAGAATLAATDNVTASRQAMREGVVDFVVTTLDEALRILKNQVRKREPVSVCVSAAHEKVVREMLERGVEPDLLPAGNCPESVLLDEFVALGARHIELQPLAGSQTLFTIQIALGSARESARIEVILAAALAADDYVNRRWLRLSKRYLGPNARRVRSVVCEVEVASKLREQLGG
jgi:urocanate hydratase